jgi:magnesium and cobalt exporter, CNNM family
MLFLELAIVFFLVLLNGLLAMSELAIVSSRPARLKAMVERNVTGSRRALALASDPGKFFSTVQIGITLVGVGSGAFSGATLGLRVAAMLHDLGLSPGLSETLGVGIVVALITYFSLIIGELVPKQIALRNPEAVAVRVAPAMTWLAKISLPVVWLLDASGRGILRLLGHKEGTVDRVTEEELRTLVAEAETAGVLEPGERAMISGVMRLGDRSVRAVMTPRHDVDTIDLTQDAASALAAITTSIHSRLPAHEGSSDEMIGIIRAKDLLDAFTRGEQPDLRAHVRQAPVIPDTLDALDVVGMLKKSSVHIGLVHDEYGHFQGVVTSADILEAIVGAFRTEEAWPEPAVPRPDGSYLIAGSMNAEDLMELLRLPPAADRQYHTAAGFVLAGLGHLPEVGESFDAHGWRFEVVDLDGRRIDKILATRVAAGRRRAVA